MTLRNSLCQVYWDLERVIDPGVVNSQQNYADLVRGWIDSDSEWLDVGCGHDIFAPWLPSAANLVAKSKLVVGLDYDLDSLKKHKLIRNRVRGDFMNPPCRDNTFNCITANMVMEHVSDPVQALTHVKRLLKPGGVFILHTPNYWHYAAFFASLIPQRLKNRIIQLTEGRHEDDVFPTFYRLNTVRDITEATRRAGLKVREFHKLSCSSSSAIFILGPLVILDLVLRRLTRWKPFENFRANFVVILEKPADGFDAR
jgi:ubiquinone/menaquinone biosynthesis C-methylase UbiE